MIDNQGADRCSSATAPAVSADFFIDDLYFE
jgi:hypothetical protein